MAYETVLYDVSDRICTIALNRPEKLNAWTRQMHLDLKEAMHTAGADPEVRAIILTGSGRGFCAGADMGGLQAIGAGAEAAAAACEDDRPDLGIGAGPVHGVLEVEMHLACPRIQFLGTVECNRANTIGHIVQNRLVRHPGAPSCAILWSA